MSNYTFKEVTKDEFFAAIGPKDVHPSTEKADVTLWRLQDTTRKVIGRSFPGWKNPSEPTRYELLVEA